MPTSDLIAGSLSGFVSCVLLQPLEVIKTRLQQQSLRSVNASPPASSCVAPVQTYSPCHILLTCRSFKEVMKPLISRPSNLWRGTVPTILRNVPGVSIYFYTLSLIRQTFIPQATRAARSSKYITLVNISAGTLARAGAGFILMPVSVIKVRFESTLYNYKGLAEASADIFRKEGFRGFFSGYGATALRDAPYAGIHLAIYEGTKVLIGGCYPPRHEADHSIIAELAFVWTIDINVVWSNCWFVSDKHYTAVWCNQNTNPVVTQQLSKSMVWRKESPESMTLLSWS